MGKASWTELSNSSEIAAEASADSTGNCEVEMTLQRGLKLGQRVDVLAGAGIIP